MKELVELINIAYDKLMFVGGLILILISVFSKRPVIIGPVNLPAVDKLGRSISVFFGILLLLFTLFVWVNSYKGLIAPSAKAIETGSADLSFIKRAYAADSDRKLIQQYRTEEIRLTSGEKIYVYAGNIRSPRKQVPLVLFKPANEIIEDIKGKKIKYKEFKDIISHSTIILSESVSEGSEYSFSYKDRQYRLKIDEILNYLIGTDYMYIKIN